jgi:hypothetical protein
LYPVSNNRAKEAAKEHGASDKETGPAAAAGGALGTPRARLEPRFEDDGGGGGGGGGVAFVKRGDAADGWLAWGKRDARRKQTRDARNTGIKKLGNDQTLIAAVIHTLDRLKQNDEGRNRHVSLASLLLSPAQRAGHPVRDERQLEAAQDVIKLDYAEYLPRELDAPVRKEIFFSSWVPEKSSDGSTLFQALALKNLVTEKNENDVIALWMRCSPDDHTVRI